MIWVIIIILAVALDQITKFIVMSNMSLGDSITLIDRFFYFRYVENKGAAWGILQNGRYFFIVMTLIISIGLAYMIYKSENKLLKFSLAVILGGAAGNLIDRIFRGSVVDFLDFYIFSYDFPVFNVADIFVVVGTFILAYYLLFVYEDKQEIKKQKKE